MYPRRLCSCDQVPFSGPMYVHAGLEGSVIALTNVLGELVERYRYTAFGLLTVLDAEGEEKDTPALSPWLYHGRLYEQSTGLYWMRMRHYSPDLGRFLQPDPAGIAGGINLYAYSNNNPLRFFDPWGLWPAPDAAGGDDGKYGEADVRKQRKSLWDRLLDAAGIVTGDGWLGTNLSFWEFYSALAMGSGQGALAFLDGAVDVIPFIDAKPFEAMGLYESSEYGLEWSQAIGSLTRDVELGLMGYGFYRAALGANASKGAVVFASEFAPSATGLVTGGDAALSVSNLTLNYGMKTLGRVETYNHFSDLANGE